MAEAMVVALDYWKAEHPLARPHFALPPKELGLIAALGDVPKIAKNESAKAIVDLFLFVGEEMHQKKPTVFMLQAALERAGYPIERVAPSELGISVVGMPAGGAPN